MTPIVTDFTPWASLAGGVLIGLAASLLMALRGRILGATGILSGALMPANGPEWSWRVVLIAGMVTGPLLHELLTGAAPAVQVPVGWSALALGGLIVGIGGTLGAGCTSGHGVCGLARLSQRSVAATVTFMTTTALTVFAIRHLWGG
jgi:uncharacterized membrane protein YedE/YeeE